MLLLASGQLQQCVLPARAEAGPGHAFAHLHMRITSPNASLNPGIGTTARSQMAKSMLPNTWPHTQPNSDTQLTDM